LELTAPALAPEALGFFRWGRVAGRVLVTTDAGDWAFLDEDEFAALLAGRIADGHPRFAELQRKGMLRDGLDLDALAARLARRSRGIRRGAALHVVTVTLRGAAGANGSAADAAALDMTPETAERIAERALETTAPALTIELHGEGGEPLLNIDAVRRLVEVAQRRNKRSTGKQLRLVLHTNLTAMREEHAEWLLANDVRIVTSLDGPAELHDGIRGWKGGSPHAAAARWIDWFTRRYAELGRDPEAWHVEALLTVTRDTLRRGGEVIDEYVRRGLRTIHLQPLLASRVGTAIWARVGYSLDAYLDFYRAALADILARNRAGVALREETASIFLTRILTGDDAGAVDVQSPYGGGTTQLAYGVDGRLFPDDDARRVDASGDPLFALGHVHDVTLPELVKHPTVRAIAAASLLDAQPMCADCWNKPYCGFSPVQNFVTQGDLFGQRPHCLQCKEHMAVSRHLFELLAAGDDEITAILTRWAQANAARTTYRRRSLTAP
jgi:His-Xaa-Ser system radical SAM maturase HxsB